MLFFKRKIAEQGDCTSDYDPNNYASSNYTSGDGTSHSSYIHQSDGFLTGQLLVSTPLITSSCFHKSVIYLFAHSHEGAMGIIINQPLELVPCASLLDTEDMPADSKLEEMAVYYGGPVDRSRGFVVHSADTKTGEPLSVHNGIAVSANTALLKDIVRGRGPMRSVLAVGYAGWTAGQLEQEIEENSWITVPATPELIFDLDNDMKWGMASQSLGIDMNFFSHTVGHA